MLVTNAQGGRVLVQSQGNITLLVEPEMPRTLRGQLLRRVLPTVTGCAVLAAVGAFAFAFYTARHERLALEQQENRFEERLMARLQSLDDRVQTSLAGQETRSASRSDQIVEHVDGVTGRLDQVAGKLDLLPQTIDKAAQGGTTALVGWLSALSARRSPAARPLTIRHADARPPRRRPTD